MKTLDEIQERSVAINNRMMDIFDELRSVRNDSDKTNDLAEELSKLLYEAKALSRSIKYFQETARKLLSEACHGPH